MKRQLRWVEHAVLLGLAGLLVWFPVQSAEAARTGVALCLDLIIPSLFPFFVVSSLLISTGMAHTLARSLDPVMGPFFGFSSTGTTAFLLGAVGGYPVGARTIGQLREQGLCSQGEAKRLSLFCNNCGPAFFLGAAGAGVFGCREAGFLLLCTNLLAALLLAFCSHVITKSAGAPENAPRKKTRESLAAAFPDCIRTAFSSTLNICAYVVLFSVLAELADCSGLLPLCVDLLAAAFPGEHNEALFRSALVGLLEISTGTAALREAASSPAALPLAAFLLGWGGLSVHCQSLPFWQQAGVSAGPYLLAKFIQGLLAAGLTLLGAHLVPMTLPVMAPLALTSVPGLWDREIIALWAMTGVYFLLTRKKGLVKRRESRYNRKE